MKMNTKEIYRDLFYFIHRNDFETIDEYLLNASEKDVNIKDVHGNTPLHYFAANGNSHDLKNFLLKGASTSTRNKYNQTPLIYAVVHMLDEGYSLDGFEKIIQLLVRYSSSDDSDVTALYEFTTQEENKILDDVVKYIESLRSE